MGSNFVSHLRFRGHIQKKLTSPHPNPLNAWLDNCCSESRIDHTGICWSRSEFGSVFKVSAEANKR